MEQLYKRYCSEKFDENGTLCDLQLQCPENFNFAYDVVDVLGREHPDKTALVWCDIHGAERRFSFGDMMRLSSRAANFLAARGVEKGDRVMLILKRHYEYWYVVLALHKLGAVVVPATHMLTGEDIVYRVQTTGISTIICTPESGVPENVTYARQHCDIPFQAFSVREELAGFERLDTAIEGYPDTFPRVQNSREDPFIMYFTSGTTGYPKAVIHNYTYPLAHIVTAVHWQCVQNNGLHLTVADTGWGKASWGKLYGQWLAGCAVMVYDFDRFVAEDLMQIIEQYRVTSFCAPPTVYRFLIQHDLTQYDLSALRHVTSAGEAINPEVIRTFRRQTGLTVMEGYGQTETTLIIANLGGSTPKAGCMGKPTPLYDVALWDEDGEESDYGEIIVHADRDVCNFGIFSSYYQDDVLYGQVWEGGVYHTGDIARRDADGYYCYVGRKDDIIKSSGYRIGPFEVENILMQHESVLECAVTGVPDEIRGMVVKAFVVLADGYQPDDALAQELQSFVKKHTAPYKYPRIIEFTETLPKTISGKTRRVELRK